MPYFFRGVYQKALSAGPSFVPQGLIQFSRIAITNPQLCIGGNGTEQCLEDMSRFRAPLSNWYHFVITAPAYNAANLDDIRIAVWVQKIGQSSPDLLRMFHDYTPGLYQEGKKILKFQFDELMEADSLMWLENVVHYTLYVGPIQFQVEWMVYHYIR